MPDSEAVWCSIWVTTPGPIAAARTAKLEADYKRELAEHFDIGFSQLYVLANMPIQRFGSMLVSKGEFANYMRLLKYNFSEANLDGVMHDLRCAVRALYKALPEEKRRDPELQRLSEMGCHTTMEIVHLSCVGAAWEGSTRDGDFSSVAMRERWEKGYEDAKRVIARAVWLESIPPNAGVVVYEPGSQASSSAS